MSTMVEMGPMGMSVTEASMVVIVITLCIVTMSHNSVGTKEYCCLADTSQVDTDSLYIIVFVSLKARMCLQRTTMLYV